MDKDSHFKRTIEHRYYQEENVTDEALLAFGKQHWAETQLELLKKEFNCVMTTAGAIEPLQAETIAIYAAITEAIRKDVWTCKIVPDAIVYLPYHYPGGPNGGPYDPPVALLFKDAEQAVEFKLRYL